MGKIHLALSLWGWRHQLSPCSHCLHVCTCGQKTTPLKGPWAGKLEELRIGNNSAAAQQNQPWGSQVQVTTSGQIAVGYFCLMVLCGKLFIAWLPAAGLRALNSHALHFASTSCPYKSLDGWPCLILIHLPRWKGIIKDWYKLADEPLSVIRANLNSTSYLHYTQL